MKVWACVLLVSLAACDAPRPPGAYVPKEKEPPSQEGFEGDAAEDARVPPDTDNDDNDDEGDVDPPIKVEDAGAPEPVVDPDSPFAKVLGKYLMRMELFSTVQATENNNTVRVDNRVSNLMYTTFVDLDGKLVSHEKVCHQTYEHWCGVGCSGWTTKLPSDLYKTINDKNVAVDREFSLQGGKLTAPQAVFLMGYSDTNLAGALPTDTSDSRVWKIQGDAKRPGIYSQLKATLEAKAFASAPITRVDFNCYASTVQRVATRYTIDFSLAQPLTAAPIVLETTGSDVLTISAQSAVSGLGSGPCDEKKLNDQKPQDEKGFVHFVRTTASDCPLEAEYEKALPGLARPSK